MNYVELEQRFLFTKKRTNTAERIIESYLCFLDSTQVVAQFLGQDQLTIVRQVYSKLRKREYTITRSMVICLMMLRGFSICEIARVLSKDHTTIIHHRDALILNPYNNALKSFIQNIV